VTFLAQSKEEQLLPPILLIIYYLELRNSAFLAGSDLLRGSSELRLQPDARLLIVNAIWTRLRLRRVCRKRSGLTCSHFAARTFAKELGTRFLGS